MKYKVNDKVLVKTRVLFRDGNNKAQTKQLAGEAGVITKLCSKGLYYVKTKYGVHYIHTAKLTPAA